MARKEKTLHYIYKTTCNVTGRWYVGMHSTNNLEDAYMGSGLRLRRSIRKYGVENHIKEILEFLPNREELVLREIEIVTKELISDEKCMNLKEGGTGGFSSKEHKIKFITEGVKTGRKKTDEILKNRFGNDENWLSKFNTEINKIAWVNEEYRKNKLKNLDWSGKKHLEETKLKISEKLKGRGVGKENSQYGTCWITKDDTTKKIKKEELNIYFKEGWVKGRKKK